MLLRAHAMALVFACFHGYAAETRATEKCLPHDFPLHPATFGGAGGGTTQADRDFLRHMPIIMISDMARNSHDWLGLNCGNTLPGDNTSVYRAFLDAGFNPIELWLLDTSPSESIEEATDDLKFFMAAIMGYTGADRVQLLAHGTGCILARLTIIKYNLAHWVESEVYIAGPFHGSAVSRHSQTCHVRPNTWWMTPGSELLREILHKGESPLFTHPADGRFFRLRTMTIRNSMPDGDACFTENADSPALKGARNHRLPGLNHDALRCARAATALYIPFLKRRARPYFAHEDLDRDGFRGAAFGGNDPDDSDPSIYPGAKEIRGDGIDQDGNGCDLAPEGGRDAEIPVHGTWKL